MQNEHHRKNIMLRAWSGDVALIATFWLIAMPVWLLSAKAFGYIFKPFIHANNFMTLFLIATVLTSLISIVMVIPVIRSAKKYKGPMAWKVFAILAAIYFGGEAFALLHFVFVGLSSLTN